MSTKITIYFDDKIHIYQECFDEKNVYIQLSEGAIETTITLTLAQAAGLSKHLCYHDIKKQAEITDEQIEKFVKETVKTRLSKEDIFAMFGSIVYGHFSEPEEKQVENGVKHFKNKRDGMKSIVEHLETKRTGSKMQFGLEEI